MRLDPSYLIINKGNKIQESQSYNLHFLSFDALVELL